MYSYSIDEWLLFFFAYSLAGYIWEVLWVSFCQKKLCNRGFLYGPFLPIYGFGAIIILLGALPFKENIPLIFLAGMVSATALEFVTGYLMLKLFKVRYWDYSKDFGNIKGYICPRASLAWGVFSLLLIKVIHPYFAGLIDLLPSAWAGTVSHLLVLYFAVDVTLSVRTVLDLKSVLEELLADENNNGIPDVLEAIPEHIREKRIAAGRRIRKLLSQNPSAVFDKKISDIAKRIHDGR